MTEQVPTKDQLKPCPFCGVKAKARRASNDSAYWIVGCTSVRCALHPELQHIDRTSAVKQWNKRFHP